ncbi:MAG: FAD-dependent oxidoreductase [Candidatus Thorarchaeota archaeon]|jgi:heterodisulfide reductase subunit A
MEILNDTRIGVFVCHCGLNIAGSVDVALVSEHAKALPNVEHSADLMFTCSTDGLKTIQDAIKEHDLNRVIVASCTPRTHEPIFRKTIEGAGLNRFLFEMVNIREHVSWCTMHDEHGANEKAKRLVEMAVARARHLEPLDLESVSIIPEIAVIGGGVAGISAALSAANGGYQVHLIERRPTIGGQMALLDKVFPQNDCAICILGPIMASVEQHPNINLLTYSEVEDVDGYVGNFKLKVRKKARYIDPEKCNSCGECVPVCPISIPNEYEFGLVEGKAIYRPFPQAVPNTFSIEKKGISSCRNACPANVNNQGFIALFREGKMKEALDVLRDGAPLQRVLGRVCHHPCEDSCVRNDYDEAVAIRLLKRYVADYVAENEYDVPESIEPSLHEKVAVVGAGPSGLTCALYLLSKGYPVTVFDSSNKPGGLISSCIPEYRVSNEVAMKDIEWILGHGITVQLNTTIGTDISLDQLRKDFDAVYIAVGAQDPARLNLEGMKRRGVLYGIPFLKSVKKGRPPKAFGNEVIVIGGGNVGIDCARTSVRLGAKKVTLVCLETRDLSSRDRMPAHDWEIEDAEEEGVKILGSLGPAKILSEGGRITGLDTTVCTSVYTADGKFSPTFSKDEGPTIKGDTVIIAIGQRTDLSGFEKLDTTPGGGLVVDEYTLETSMPGIFAGGDVVTGPSSVIEAIAHGKEAAVSIQRYLTGEDLYKGRKREMHIVSSDEVDFEQYPQFKRARPRTLSRKMRRTSFEEVELGFLKKYVVQEAERCMSCAVCSECKECLEKCEPDAIDHDMKDDLVELDVGAIIVATGGESYKPVESREYGFGFLPDVVTNAQFERITNAAGPTHGKIKRPSDGKTPESIAFVQCVGARDPRAESDYCCYFGCENSLKQATQIKEKYPETEVNIYAIDVRTHGPGYEDLYQRALNMGVIVVKGKASEVEADLVGNGVRVFAEDLYTGRNTSLSYDMVVLATPQRPQSDSVEFARTLGVNIDRHGFFLCAHPKLRPVESFKDGVFFAGACVGPADIRNAVAQGRGAAAMAQSLISSGRFDIEPIYAEIDNELCNKCELCIDFCPYSAPKLEEGKIVIMKELCQGCGTCAAGCPQEAIDMRHYRRSQIIPMIHTAVQKTVKK